MIHHPRILWLVILGLSLGPAVSNGFARFSYGLVLPAMRADLGWSFTEAGWINTANAIGYLIGALLAFAVIGRVGARALFILGMGLTAVALVGSATTRDFALLSWWRVLAGVGGAPVFIAGGVMASAIFAHDKAKNALAVSVYFGGGGIGMILSGVALPLMVERYGVGIWPLTWLLLGAATWVAAAFSYFAAVIAPAPNRPEVADGRIPVRALIPGLLCYFLFGAGYIVHMTFLIAWMEGEGASVALVIAAWAILSIGVMASPFLWAPIFARAEGGRGMALTSLGTGAGVLAALAIPGPAGVVISAVIFGLSFFMVPTASTSFVRKNITPGLWGGAISLFTIFFSLGQIAGPVGAGYVADLTGGPRTGLFLGGLILLLGALLGAAQRPLRRKDQP